MGREVQVSLSRDLSLFDITMIGIAGMIGAGIFALTGIAAGIAGPAILLAFLLNGIIATLTGLAYAELGSALPQAGGGYVWIKEAMGKFPGFLAGWIDWAAHTIACALYAVTFGAFFAEFVIGFAGFDLPRLALSKVSALFMVSFLAYVNYRGAKESGKLGSLVTLLKVLILVVFAGFGIYRTLTHPDWISSYAPFLPTGFTGVLAAMGLTFIAFEGFEIIVQSGEEVKNPEKNIPRAIVMSLWTAVAIYILVAFSLLGAIKADVPSWMYLGELAELSLVRVADSIMLFGGYLILAGGIISTVSAMNATIYSSSRVIFALSRTGYLHRIFSEINRKTRTPHHAIFFSYLIVAIASLAPIEAVASAASLMFIILFLSVNASLIILRLRRPDLRRSFKLPFAYLLSSIAIVFQIVISYYLITQIEHGFSILIATVGWMFLGAFVYYAYSEKEIEKKIKEEFVTVYSEFPVEKKEYRILVPVANPVIARKLVRLAEIIARQKDGMVYVMSVVRVPLQTPPSAVVNEIRESKEFLEGIIEHISVPAGGILKAGHNVAEAIIATAEELQADLVIMGWRGRTFRKDAVLGSTIDPVLMKAGCDVAVVRFKYGEKMPEFRKILVPSAAGPHVELACELAECIAKERNGSVMLMYVGKSAEDEKEAQKVFETLSERYFGDVEIENEFIIDSNPVKRIAEEAEKHDITLLGASERAFLYNFLRGFFPEKVIKRTDSTVVVTRKWVRLMG